MKQGESKQNNTSCLLSPCSILFFYYQDWIIYNRNVKKKCINDDTDKIASKSRTLPSCTFQCT